MSPGMMQAPWSVLPERNQLARSQETCSCGIETVTVTGCNCSMAPDVAGSSSTV